MKLTAIIRLVFNSCSLAIALLLSAHVAVSQVPEKVSHDVQQHFIPFDSATGIPGEFLDKLKEKRIVGLGEATHGTAEFERMFSQLCKALVLQQGFNVIVLAEANFYDTHALNDYVVHGKGDPETAIRLVRHQPAPFVEEEFRMLAEWVRSHNKTLPVGERVWMLGADAMSPRGAAFNALNLCRALKVNLPEATSQLLSEISALPESLFEDYATRNSMSWVLSRTAPLHYALQQKAIIDSLSFKQRRLLQSVATLDNAIRFFYDNYLYHRWSAQQFRDRAMLSNIKWILQERPNAKLLLYAHNAHLQKRIGYQPLSNFGPYLGGQLDSTYANSYYAICTEAQTGLYWAGADDGNVPVVSNKKKIGDLVGRMTAAPFGFLELNATPKLKAYFNSPLYMTFGVLEGSNNSPARVSSLSSAFDALLFVRESTPKLRVKPKGELKRFSFNYNMPPELIAKVSGQGKFMVSLTGSFLPAGTSHSDEGASLGILFLNGNRETLGYHAVQLEEIINLNQGFAFPAGTQRILLSITGSSVQEFTLGRLAVNGHEIEAGRLQYYGEGYDKRVKFEKEDILHLSLTER